MHPDDQHPGDRAYGTYLRDFQTRVVGPAVNNDTVWEIDPLVSFLKGEYGARIFAETPLVINSETTVGFMPEFPDPERLERDLIRRASNEIPVDLMRDFCAKNRHSRVIWPELESYLPLRLFSRAEQAAIFTGNPDEGWKQFSKKYPKSVGIIELSRVGFNRSRTIALFYLGWQGGSLAGSGRLYVMKKTGSLWNVLPISIGPAWKS
jgi:hypothetical protein